MSAEHIYEVSVSWKSGREGVLESPVLNKSIEVATPPQFPKGVEGVWSPEHLLVAAVNSCLMTTFLAIAENSKLEFSGFDSKASGQLEIVDGKFMMTEITIRPVLLIADEQHKERAERILQKAEANCLIANSIKSKIVVEPLVRILTESGL